MERDFVSPDEIITELTSFEGVSERPTIVYYEQEGFGKGLHEVDLPIFDHILKGVPSGSKLNLILNTNGGDLGAVQRIIRLIRDVTEDYEVYIAFKAASCGTVLSFSAKKIYLSKLSTLSPFDPLLTQIESGNTALPSTVSSQDIRSFLEMSKEWFGLDSQDSYVKILELLCSKFFPTTLSKFYRAEKHMIRYVTEILKLQLPSWSKQHREDLVTRVMYSYPYHSYPIDYLEAKDLGLNVEFMSEDVLEIIEKLISLCRRCCLEITPYQAERGVVTNALLFDVNCFSLCQMSTRDSSASGSTGGSDFKFATAMGDWITLD